MIKIAICDDERRFVDQIRDILEEYCEEIGQMVYIEGFYDGRMLLDQYSCQFDVVFLDIRMPQMDGMEAAKKIREGSQRHNRFPDIGNRLGDKGIRCESGELFEEAC